MYSRHVVDRNNQQSAQSTPVIVYHDHLLTGDSMLPCANLGRCAASESERDSMVSGASGNKCTMHWGWKETERTSLQDVLRKFGENPRSSPRLARMRSIPHKDGAQLPTATQYIWELTPCTARCTIPGWRGTTAILRTADLVV